MSVSQYGLLAGVVLAAGLASAVAAGPGNVTDERVAADTTGEGWLVKGGGFAQQQFSPLSQINEGNVGTLGVAWVAELDEPMGLAAEPIVVDGVIYLSAPRSVVYAIDAASGSVLWKHDPHIELGHSLDGSYSARVNRGVAVWDGKVYVGTGDCRLLALDAAHGSQLWEAKVCDAGLTGVTGAPRVAGGRVFIGYAGADEQIRGSLVAFDAATGKELWRFWTVPGDPTRGAESRALQRASFTWPVPGSWQQGGGTVWDAITYDATTGLVLFGTSKSFAEEGTDGQTSAGGAKLYAGSIVAVHADTGEYAWHYQTSTRRRQTENFHIVLADLPIRGRTRHVALTAARNGTFYCIDALTGKLIGGRPLVRLGPLSAADGQPLSYPGVVVHGVEDCPGKGCFGVRNWWPMSYSPLTHLTYVPIMDRRRSTPAAGQLAMVGRLVAWDPATQTTRWSVENPLIVNSGVLSTGGNLVFQGQGTGEFAAYAALTGKKLWSVRTGSSINAVPVSYRLHGEQYIVVPVGWGSAFRLFAPSSMFVTPESKYGPSRLIAFRLGATGTIPVRAGTIPAVPRPPQQTYEPAAVKRGAELADAHGCTGCHSPDLDGSGRWVEDGAVPDLRYMPAEVHRDWSAIVLGGSHRGQGMLSFGTSMVHPDIAGLNGAEAEDIHAYVIDRAWAAYNAQQNAQAAR